MACGLGLPDACDCAADHWSPVLGGRRERNGQWRAPCPVEGCGSWRALEYDAPGKHVRWKSFCGKHDKDAVKPYLATLIGPCMPSRRAGRHPIGHDELIAVALADMPPTSLRLVLLEMAGLGTSEALDKLGVRRENRARVIAGRASIPMQKPR
jgi:hypothetical protein